LPTTHKGKSEIAQIPKASNPSIHHNQQDRTVATVPQAGVAQAGAILGTHFAPHSLMILANVPVLGLAVYLFFQMQG